MIWGVSNFEETPGESASHYELSRLRLTVTSCQVKDHFGNKHDNVLRYIRALIVPSPKWGRSILNRPHIRPHRTASHYAMTRDGALSVTRRQVAEHFGKQHKNVLQSIGNLECSDEFARLNFQPSEYLDDKGEARAEYATTRDGFTSSVTFATSSRKTLNGVPPILGRPRQNQRAQNSAG